MMWRFFNKSKIKELEQEISDLKKRIMTLESETRISVKNDHRAWCRRPSIPVNWAVQKLLDHHNLSMGWTAAIEPKLEIQQQLPKPIAPPVKDAFGSGVKKQKRRGRGDDE